MEPIIAQEVIITYGDGTTKSFPASYLTRVTVWDYIFFWRKPNGTNRVW